MKVQIIEKQFISVVLGIFFFSLMLPTQPSASSVDSALAQTTVSATSITSSSINLTWPTITGASGYKIYLAPEPASLGNSAERKLIATLDSGVLSYQITHLAANVNVFLRIEAIGATQYYDFYAKTKGGQGVALDNFITSGAASTSIESVSLVAPNVLLLVIKDKRAQSYSLNSDTLDKGVDQLVNDTGASWQSGSWTITRNNGSSLSVSNVYRDSIPAGNMYDVILNNGNTWGGDQLSQLMDLEHFVYLKLNGTVGQQDILSVTGPNNLSLTIPYSDQYLETPVIQVNQVGYNPRATKRYAYVGAWMGDGGSLSLSNFPNQAKVLVESSSALMAPTAVVSGIAIATRSASDTIAGTEVKEISLASVPSNDSAFYHVYIPGVGVSYRTMVSELATLKAYYVTTRGLFLNRWGRDLNCAYTDWCSRPPDHQTVYTGEGENQVFFAQDTPLTGARTLAGGHHDAGDFDIKQQHYIVARQLMRAYELNTSAFTDSQLNIPESGNGIPDFLDEVLWSIGAWEQLQESDGGVRMGVESWRHPWGSYFADADPLTFWTYRRDPLHSIRVAGLFAQASRLVAPFNSTKAATLQAEAIAAYNYATSNGVTESIDGPILYATSELYRLTGEQQYKDKFESTWSSNLFYNTGMPSIRELEYWASAFGLTVNQPVLGDFILGYLGATGDATTTAYLNLADARFTADANAEVTAINNNYAYRSGLPTNFSTAWGKSVAQGEYLMAIYSKMQLGTATGQEEQNYIDALSLATDYILGANPMGMSWVTGLGTRSPQNPLHTDSIAFQMLYGMPPIPGIPVYGPATLTAAASYYDYGRNAMYPSVSSRPTLRKYGDLRSFVDVNEFTIWETQSNVSSLFATLVGSGLSVPTAWQPGHIDHQQRLPLEENVQTASVTGVYTPICGDGLVEGTEQCDDGNVINGDGCSSVCAVTYQCNDGVDNDSDGKIDYPVDTGCASDSDNNETNSTQACVESWTCTTWSSCTGGAQTRTCTDAHACGTIDDRPSISQSCSGSTAPNAGGNNSLTPVPTTSSTPDINLPAVPVEPSGSLVKLVNSPKIYFIGTDGKRSYIPTYGVFLAHHFSSKDVKVVSDAELNSHATSTDLTYPAKTLFKGANSSAVFVFDNGKRQVFFNAKYFLSNNYAWSNIVTIPQDDIDAITLAGDVKYPEGTLIKGEGINVYLIENGLARRIASEQAFNDLGLDWLNLIVVSPLELSFYTQGADIKAAVDVTATLIASLDPDGDHVYSYLEKIYGTNPSLTDTDGDGYSDYAEIKTGHNPLKK